MRTTVVLLLLSVVIGLFAVMVQAAFQTQEQLENLQARLRTLIELREAGAFGTGGFGGDKPAGAEEFSVATLEMIKRIPNAKHITKIDEYVHIPQMDATKQNAYAMIIGLRPGAPMRAIGEVDYENAKIIAGRGLDEKNASENVAVVGRLYAKERAGTTEMDASALKEKKIALNEEPLQVGGVLALVLMITVIFFVTLMQVRERTKEIGTLKAIGASDGGVTVEVLTEAIALTILGGLVALISFRILGETITGPVFAFGITPFLPSHYKPLVQSLSVSNQISVSGLGVLILGAVLASAIGSAYGLWQVIKLSPLEAMKHE